MDIDNITVTLDQNEAVGYLLIGTGSKLKINSLVTCTVAHTEINALVNIGTIENLGTLSVSNAHTGKACVFNRGTLQNLGTMHIQGGFVGIGVYSGSEFLNYGVCTITNSDIGAIMQGSYSDDVSSQLTISNCITSSLTGFQSEWRHDRKRCVGYRSRKRRTLSTGEF